MDTIIKPKKIAFCTTCMNRLHHLQQTLEKNILDNYLIEDVEFILLDYNSQDGLEQWVYQNMQKYIDTGILIYYRTFEPAYYFRSHSRNMAFRLANADILCNLDADNFLGKGFASFMMQEFSKHDNIFYANNFSCNDTFGRICVRKKDFMSIRGYNEVLIGYGYEDMDVFNRLKNSGLNQMCFNDPEFYHFVLHSDIDRISEEYMIKNVTQIYIAYINPYTSEILLLYKDFKMERYTLLDNSHLNDYTGYSNTTNRIADDRYRITIQDSILTGKWSEDKESIHIWEDDFGYDTQKETSLLYFKGRTYYKVHDMELKAKLFTILSETINYYEANKQMEGKSVINPEGFGKGIVFRNFDLSKKIILS